MTPQSYHPGGPLEMQKRYEAGWKDGFAKGHEGYERVAAEKEAFRQMLERKDKEILEMATELGLLNAHLTQLQEEIDKLRGKRERAEKAGRAEDAEIPAALKGFFTGGRSFTEHWWNYLAYRRERRLSCTRSWAERSLKRMVDEKWTPEEAVAALDYSAAQAYQGIVLPYEMKKQHEASAAPAAPYHQRRS